MKRGLDIWRSNNRSKFEQAWKDKPLFLPHPSLRQSTQHKLTLERFFPYSGKSDKGINQRLKEIDSPRIVQRGNL